MLIYWIFNSKAQCSVLNNYNFSYIIQIHYLIVLKFLIQFIFVILNLLIFSYHNFYFSLLFLQLIILMLIHNHMDV